MGVLVCNGALLMCSFGTAPSSLVVLPKNKVLSGTPSANIMDNIPMTNIMPFAMCNSVANPATKRPPPVLFTPAPCVPVIPGPWVPGCPTTMIAGMPAVNNTCTLTCAYGGVITVTYPGQTTVMA